MYFYVIIAVSGINVSYHIVVLLISSCYSPDKFNIYPIINQKNAINSEVPI